MVVCVGNSTTSAPALSALRLSRATNVPGARIPTDRPWSRVMRSGSVIDSRLIGRRIAIIFCGLMAALLVGTLPCWVPRDLTLALLIGSVSLFFLATRPLWLLGILVLYVPFHGLLRPAITSEAIAVSEVLGGVSLIGGVKDVLVVVLFAYAVVRTVREQRLIKLTAVDRLMVLFLTWTGLEVARSAFMGRSLVAAVLDVRVDVEYLVLYWVVATFVRNARQMTRLVQATVYGAGVAGAVGAAFARAGQRVIMEGAEARAVGTFAQSQTNVYAVYMAMVAVLLVALLAEGRQRIVGKAAGFLALAISVLTVFLTQSRRGFLALIAGSLCCFYLLYRRRPESSRWPSLSRQHWRVLKVLPFLLLAMAVLVLTVVPGRWSLRYWGLPTWDTFKAIVSGERYGRLDTVTGFSVEPRLVEIVRTLRILSGQYLLGAGPASDLITEIFVQRGFAFHNYYVGLWFRLGLIGLLIYVALVVAIIKHGLHIYSRLENPSLRSLTLGVLSSWVAISAVGLLGSQTSSLQIGVLSWLWLGAMRVASELPRDGGSRQARAGVPE